MTATHADLQLTDRQVAVLERLDRRVPIKGIAADLDISVTRVNQHIRDLKDKFGAGSLTDLVERARARGALLPNTTSPIAPYTKDACTKKQVGNGDSDPQNDGRVADAEYLFSDVQPMLRQPPWLAEHNAPVVPGMLDGEQAGVTRLAAMVGIAVGLIAAAILTIAAGMALGDVLDDTASVSVENIAETD